MSYAQTLPRTFVLTVNRPIARFDATAKHLKELKIPFERFDGLDNQLCRLNPIDTFDLDRSGERIGPKHVAACLSHYMLWKCLSMQPEDSFIAFEYDVVLSEDFRTRFHAVMKDVPDDWQVLFIGSCCCEGREKKHIAGDVYEVQYPLCGHALYLRKSALPILLQECQRIWAPLDIALFYGALTKLRTYTVLPPLVTQRGTPLPP